MKNFNLDAILEAMLKVSDRVSDLNFSVGRPPQVEVDGQLVGGERSPGCRGSLRSRPRSSPCTCCAAIAS
jgi:Tfp pilus assembly ATPase PilU